MKIDGHTRKVGLFGYPVKHSFSPAMHNAAYRSMGVNFVYVAYEVALEDLEAAVHGVVALGFEGLNFTIPHKQTIMKLVDELDPEAELIGAVNTITITDGRMTGYNTDAPGFIHSLEQELEFQPKGKRAVLIGAGGGARAVSGALLRRGLAALRILNKPFSWAEELCSHLSEKVEGEIELSAKPLESPPDTITEWEPDLIVNATPLGMQPADPSPLEGKQLPGSGCYYDLIYNVAETPGMKQAGESGLKTSNGLGMLVEQGAIAIEKWTGQSPPRDLMRKTVQEILS